MNMTMIVICIMHWAVLFVWNVGAWAAGRLGGIKWLSTLLFLQCIRYSVLHFIVQLGQQLVQ